MVSSGTVQGDLGSLKSALNNYNSEVSGLAGSWKGSSYDNLNSKASEFVSEYSGIIDSQMTAFASACDAYEEYKNTKSLLQTAQSNYEKAVANNNTSAASSYNSEATGYQKDLDTLKTKINSLLQEAASQTLDAQTSSISVDGTSVSQRKSGGKANGTTHLDDGSSYWQVQQLGENCAMTAFLVAVNTALGENKYTDNATEYYNIGGNTETLGWTGDNRSIDWIKNHGLSNRLEVTGIENIHSRQDLADHLNNGEVVVASSTGTVFKRNDGSKAYYDHYITFYAVDEDGNFYANDSSSGDSSQVAGVKYTPEDVDQFYAVGNHGSITVKAI